MRNILFITSFFVIALSAFAHAQEDPFAALEKARDFNSTYDDPFDRSNEPSYFKETKPSKDDKIKYENHKRAPDFMQLDTTGRRKPASSQEVFDNMMKTR